MQPALSPPLVCEYLWLWWAITAWWCHVRGQRDCADVNAVLKQIKFVKSEIILGGSDLIRWVLNVRETLRERFSCWSRKIKLPCCAEDHMPGNSRRPLSPANSLVNCKQESGNFSPTSARNGILPTAPSLRWGHSPQWMSISALWDPRQKSG